MDINDKRSDLHKGQKFAFALLFTSMLGVHLIGIDLGAFRLSPYRLLILFAPFILLHISRNQLTQFKDGINFDYYKFLIIWILYSVLSLLWLSDLEGWSRIFIFLLSSVVTSWILGVFFNNNIRIIKLLTGIELSSLFFASFGVWEILTGRYLFLRDYGNISYYGGESLMHSSIGFRMPFSIFGNPNHFAVFLLFSLVFSFILFQVKDRKRGRIFSFMCFLLFVFLLIATQSRASFIGLVLFFFSTFILRVKKKNLPKLILSLSILCLISIPLIISNFHLFEPLLNINSNEIGSDMIRQNLINNGLYFLKESFFFGVGLGNIEYHMYFNSIFDTKDVTNIHNWWMEILVSSGVLILAIYIFIYLKNLRRLYHIFKYSTLSNIKVIASGFFGLLIGLIIASIGPSSLLISEWFLPLFSVVMLFINQFKGKNI